MEIKPGEVTTRKAMAKRFGGTEQGGIQPCRMTPSVLIYTDPETGPKSGYYDGWLPREDVDEPTFEYTGHGQGHQVFGGRDGRGNAAILKTLDDGRTLHVFRAVGYARKRPELGVRDTSGAKAQLYLGAFALDEESPFELREHPNEDGLPRRVIVFRFHPNDEYEYRSQDELPAERASEAEIVEPGPPSELVAPAPRQFRKHARAAIKSVEVGHPEDILLDEYRAFLEGQPRRHMRNLIRVKGRRHPLYTDLFDCSAGVLYEAKATNRREDVRMAIGQLYDYHHHLSTISPGSVEVKRLAILLPARPSDDLCKLLKKLEIALVYRHGDTFVGGPVS